MSGGNPGVQNYRKSANPALDAKAAKTRPCLRCGRRVEPSHHKGTKVKGVCRDCRDTDPLFVASQAPDAPPILRRTSDRPPNWAEQRRRQWAQALGQDDGIAS